MPRLPGVNHLDAVRALEKVGFYILRQGRHIVMTDGARKVTIPRHNPINAFTLGGIVQDAGLTVEQFRELARASGWEPRRVWTDASSQFSVHELVWH